MAGFFLAFIEFARLGSGRRKRNLSFFKKPANSKEVSFGKVNISTPELKVSSLQANSGLLKANMHLQAALGRIDFLTDNVQRNLIRNKKVFNWIMPGHIITSEVLLITFSLCSDLQRFYKKNKTVVSG